MSNWTSFKAAAGALGLAVAVAAPSWAAEPSAEGKAAADKARAEQAAPAPQTATALLKATSKNAPFPGGVNLIQSG